MNPPETPENDPLDALLREQNPYLDDHGFTVRVMARLPRRRNFSWVRALVLSLAAVIGCVLTFLWLPSENLPALTISSVMSSSAATLTPWLSLAALLAALYYSVLGAMREEE